jgi:hypothetical protein
VPGLLERHTEERALAARNRRTAWWLVAWITFLMAVSIAVIWIRN